MNNKIALIFTGLFVFLCLLLSAGVWFSLAELRAYREEYDMLDAERHNYTGNITRLQQKNKTLTEINSLNIANTGTAHDTLAFYSEIRQCAENNSMNILSMASDQGENGGTGNIIKLQVEGNYYSLAHMIADWRQIPFASRINSLVVKRDAIAPTEFVQADIEVEAQLTSTEEEE